MGNAPESTVDGITAFISPRDPPTRARCGDLPTPEMIKAFEQFNRGEYWEQHETLEGLWRAESDPSIRNLLKGILQVGVGLHHLTHDNYAGVTKVLARAVNYLGPYAPECYGVDVARLMAEAAAIYRQAVELGPARLHEIPLTDLPRVHYERP